MPTTKAQPFVDAHFPKGVHWNLGDVEQAVRKAQLRMCVVEGKCYVGRDEIIGTPTPHLLEEHFYLGFDAQKGLDIKYDADLWTGGPVYDYYVVYVPFFMEPCVVTDLPEEVWDIETQLLEAAGLFISLPIPGEFR